MATIINTPPTSGDNSMALLFVGVLFTATAIGLFLLYGVPAIRNMDQSESPTPSIIEVQLPTPTEPTAQAPVAEPALTTNP